MANINENTGLMEPMLPFEGHRELEDLAVGLIEKSAKMAGQLNPIVQEKIGDLVRSMNCYYSNLIEGHNTHPIDIEKALKKEFDADLKKRDLQLEAKAHIEVQAMIDANTSDENIFTEKFIKWIHKEFYSRLPEGLFWLENPDTGKKIKIIAGEFRDGDVAIGWHIPPMAKNISTFIARFGEAYNFEHLSRAGQIIAVASAHHRLLWIHPFYDGNGRVARLLSHAAFLKTGAGNRLWSISRGLARNSQVYKQKLAQADEPREGDLDGRGSLSQKHLIGFCKFFIETAIDQIDFMSAILDVSGLLTRIEKSTAELIGQKKLLKGSDILLKEALIKGTVPRGAVPTITGYSERQSREIVATLVKQKMLASDTPYGDLYLKFPQKVLDGYFPKLYPPELS